MKVQYNAQLTLMRWCTLISTLCILLRNVAGYVTPKFQQLLHTLQEDPSRFSSFLQVGGDSLISCPSYSSLSLAL